MRNNPEVDVIEHILAEIHGIQQIISRTSVYPSSIESSKTTLPSIEPFVDPARLKELRTIQSHKYDLSKLIRYCEELNANYEGSNFLACAMLGRAILDHIPPIFSCKNFSEVAYNYPGGSKSFKQSMEHLEKSLRKIADAHLHVQIRKSEILPNRTQVNFSSDLDVLLAEVVRVLK
jgi:hypothetical protein